MSTRRYTSRKDELFSGKEAPDSRVYVNNMNTPQPTVTIPKNASYDNHNYRVNMFKLGERKPGETAAQTLFGGSHDQKQQQQGIGRGSAYPTTTASAGGDAEGKSGGAAGSSAAATSPSRARVVVTGGEELHPNLEAVYKRIMRRLQRELNYEELSHATLAEQYGIGGDPDDPAAQQRGAGVEVLTFGGTGASRTSSFALNDSQVLNMTGTSSRPGTGAGLESPVSAAGSGRPGSGRAATSADGEKKKKKQSVSEVVGSGGMAVRYTHDTGAAAKAGAAVTAGPVAKVPTALSAEEGEQLLSEQPCPATLRLVIAHVQETLQRKLEVAEQGSLKDCLRFTFESRALLDRLLKEIPHYAQFKVADRGDGGAGGPVRLPLQELFQDFKRQPAVLPKANYVENTRTGAVHAELDTSRLDAIRPSSGHSPRAGDGAGDKGPASPRAGFNDTAGSVSSGGGGPPPPGFLPSIMSHHGSSGGESRSSGAQALVQQYSQASQQILAGPPRAAGDPTAVSLPETYGKSARLAQARQAEIDAQPVSSAAIQQQQQTALVSILRGGAGDKAGGGGGADGNATTAGSDSLAWAEEPSSPTAADEMGSSTTGAPSRAGRSRRGTEEQTRRARDAYFEDQRSRRQATQMVSVGTITEDDNGLTVVPREEHERLADYARRLEVELAEREREKDGMRAQIAHEANYTERRAQILKYLRETLWRECNLLRSQLNFAEKKEAYLTNVVKEQQQQHYQQQQARGAGADKGGGGGGTGRSGNDRSFVVLSGRSRAGGSTVLGPGETSNDNNHNGGGGSDMQHSGFIDNISLSRYPASSQAPGASVANVHGMGGNPGMSIAGASSAASYQNYNNNNNMSGNSAHGPASDVAAVQSLLDLALLAVEKEEAFPATATTMKTMDPQVASHVLTKNPERQKEELLATYEEREYNLKQSLIQLRLRSNFIIAERDREIERLLKLTNMDYVESSLKKSVATLRADLRKLRMLVEGELQSFATALQTATTALTNRARIMDKTADENLQLHTTQEALRDVIDAASSLFTPMATPEYVHGYHPWPLKLRNSADPFAHIVQTRYGAPEVLRLRDSLSLLAGVYLSLHKFVSGLLVTPDYSRPAAGEPFRILCAGLLLSPACTTDIIFEVRRRYATEVALRKRAAQTHAALLWNLYLQKVYMDRSIGAMVSANIDPQSAAPPVAARINALAAARNILAQDKAELAKERFDNAKEVFRLWKDRQIDIYDGHAAPTVVTRLTLLANTPAAGGHHQGSNTGVRLQGGKQRGRSDSL